MITELKKILILKNIKGKFLKLVQKDINKEFQRFDKIRCLQNNLESDIATKLSKKWKKKSDGNDVKNNDLKK